MYNFLCFIYKISIVADHSVFSYLRPPNSYFLSKSKIYRLSSEGFLIFLQYCFKEWIGTNTASHLHHKSGGRIVRKRKERRSRKRDLSLVTENAVRLQITHFTYNFREQFYKQEKRKTGDNNPIIVKPKPKKNKGNRRGKNKSGEEINDKQDKSKEGDGDKDTFNQGERDGEVKENPQNPQRNLMMRIP